MQARRKGLLAALIALIVCAGLVTPATAEPPPPHSPWKTFIYAERKMQKTIYWQDGHQCVFAGSATSIGNGLIEITARYSDCRVSISKAVCTRLRVYWQLRNIGQVCTPNQTGFITQKVPLEPTRFKCTPGLGLSIISTFFFGSESFETTEVDSLLCR